MKHGMGRRTFCGLAAALAILTGAVPASAADKIKYGMLRVPSALFVAMEKGYFAAEGIEVSPIFFRSGAELVPSLSTGQLDAAATSPGAALYNAMAQGVNAVIVADYYVLDRDQPGGDPNGVIVRKDLVDSGKIKTASDLKGTTIAITARGQVTDLFAGMLLGSGGLTAKDARIVQMPYPDMLAALQGKSIDVAVAVDPFMTIAENEGFAVHFRGMADVVPGLNLGVVMYGDRMGKKDRALGMRFMKAFDKGNTYLRKRLREPGGRAEIAEIYQKHLPLKTQAMYEKVSLGLGREHLMVDVEGRYGLRWQLKWYTDLGLVPKQPDLKTGVDNSFAEAAAKANQ